MASEKVLECGKAIAAKHWTITFVESASAGKLSYEFSTVPESDVFLIGGIVCYNTNMKTDVLHIPKEFIEKFTPESAEVAKAMANNFCKLTESDICVAMTGLTTAGGSESDKNPVGTIFIHITFPDRQIAESFIFEGNPEEIVEQAIEQTASLILTEIN